jgi:hypothetical protein
MHNARMRDVPGNRDYEVLRAAIAALRALAVQLGEALEGALEQQAMPDDSFDAAISAFEAAKKEGGPLC